MLAISAETWTAVGASNPAVQRATAVQPLQLDALQRLWSQLWLLPAATDDVAALMHYRGLLRTLDRRQAAPLEAWVQAAMSTPDA